MSTTTYSSPLAGERAKPSRRRRLSRGGELVIRDRARTLRKEPTDAERKLWWHLRSKQLAGYKFRRQQPIDHYIVDFVSFDHRIIIELDGSQHMERRDCDNARTTYLEQFGFRVLRFWNNDVLQNTDAVLQVIFDLVASPPTLTLPRRGGGKNNAPPPQGGSESTSHG